MIGRQWIWWEGIQEPWHVLCEIISVCIRQSLIHFVPPEAYWRLHNIIKYHCKILFTRRSYSHMDLELIKTEVVNLSQVVLTGKNLPADAGDIRHTGWIPAWGKSPGEGNANPLQYSCLENPLDRGARWAVVHGLAKNRTQLKWLCTHIVSIFIKNRLKP